MTASLRQNAPVLVLLVVAALVLAWLAWRPAEESLPTGSSTSYLPDGGRGLYLWVESLGLRPRVLERLAFPPDDVPSVLLLLQPQLPLSPADRSMLDDVAGRGGRVVVAGDSPGVLALLRGLGVEVSSDTVTELAAVPGELPSIEVDTRLRLRASNAAPLLVAPDGDWVALRRPYRAGTLVAFISVLPLTNDGLRRDDAAKLVLREVLGGLPEGAVVAFSEAHYPPTSAAGGARGADEAPGRLMDLVLESDAGRAVVYLALLGFASLALAGRRLGPPLPPPSPATASRAMYEHVQALAGLYRRAGQRPALRAHFARHYRRQVARSLGLDAARLAGETGLAEVLRAHGQDASTAERLSEALRRVEAARGEAQLLDAVAHAEAALAGLPRAASGAATLSVASGERGSGGERGSVGGGRG